MLKFINGLPAKLAFYVRSRKPEYIAEAISLAKADEAYKYMVHVESVAAAKAL
jgi:CRISPR/Cas system CMR-associated protein Cmr5 small subunit